MGLPAVAKYVLEVIGATVAGYFGGKLAGTGSNVVVDRPQQTEVYQIINSTNVKLNSLADQHNQHRSDIEQYFLAGAVALGIVVFVLVCAGCCCFLHLRKQLRRNSPNAFKRVYSRRSLNRKAAETEVELEKVTVSGHGKGAVFE